MRREPLKRRRAHLQRNADVWVCCCLLLACCLLLLLLSRREHTIARGRGCVADRRSTRIDGLDREGARIRSVRGDGIEHRLLDAFASASARIGRRPRAPLPPPVPPILHCLGRGASARQDGDRAMRRSPSRHVSPSRRAPMTGRSGARSRASLSASPAEARRATRSTPRARRSVPSLRVVVAAAPACTRPSSRGCSRVLPCRRCVVSLPLALLVPPSATSSDMFLACSSRHWSPDRYSARRAKCAAAEISGSSSIRRSWIRV